MRDLHATGSGVNGLPPADEPEESVLSSEELATRVRRVKRDQKLADITVMLLDSAKLVEPLVELLHARMLRWAAVVSAVALAFYALRSPSWERLAIMAVFMVLVPFLIRGK